MPRNAISTSKVRFAILALGVVAAGCGSEIVRIAAPPFTQDSLYSPDNTTGARQVLAKLAAAKPSPIVDVAVAATGPNDLVAVDLQDGHRWTAHHALSQRPTVAGPLVLAAGGDKVSAFDAKTGALRWTTPLRGRMTGAGSDGTWTALTFDQGGHFSLRVIGESGGTSFDLESDGRLGVPAVAAGLVLAPWKSLYVSVFDARSGRLHASFLTQVESWEVRAFDEVLFAGRERLVPLDAALVPPAEKAARTGSESVLVTPPPAPDFARKELLRAPGPLPLRADAFDATARVGRPRRDGAGVGFADDRVYAAYYRLVVGLDSKGQLMWVRSTDADIVQLHAGGGAVWVIDQQGRILALGARDGSDKASFRFDAQVLSADITTDRQEGSSEGAGKSSLIAEIRKALVSPDSRLVPAQVYLVKQLAHLPGQEGSAVLTELLDNPKTPPAIRAAASEALGGRKEGSSDLIDALRRRASFLTGVQPPAIGPLARALRSSSDPRVAPLLMDHVEDPATPESELPDAAETVGALAERGLLPRMRQYVEIHRTYDGSASLAKALGALAFGVVRLDQSGGTAWVEGLLKDEATDVEVREALATHTRASNTER